MYLKICVFFKLRLAKPWLFQLPTTSTQMTWHQDQVPAISLAWLWHYFPWIIRKRPNSNPRSWTEFTLFCFDFRLYLPMRRPLLLITSLQRQARVYLWLQEVGGRGNPEEQPRRRCPQDYKDLELSPCRWKFVFKLKR